MPHGTSRFFAITDAAMLTSLSSGVLGSALGEGSFGGGPLSSGGGSPNAQPAMPTRATVTGGFMSTAPQVRRSRDGATRIVPPRERPPFVDTELGPAGACDGLLASAAVAAPAHRLRVFPVTAPFRAVEAMPQAAGLVGVHRSRRPGEGGELAGVRVFAPGDRLRRIDWRVSLRPRYLRVASTLSDRDAEVLLLLDVLGEAGASGGVKGKASVLDTTVRAAAAVAEHYLQRGHRVSLLESAATARPLRPATGRRQYLPVLEWLLDRRAEDGR